MAIGEIIKKGRLNKKISQKILAEKIGVDVSYICKIEKNEKKVSLDKLKAISDELSLEYEELKYLFYFEKINSSFIDESDVFIVEVLKKIINSYNV